MATLYGAQTPATHESDDLIARNAGRRLQFSVDGSITGWRLWVANTLPETELKWQLWNNADNTKLAEVDVLALTPATGGWASGSLGSPVAVTTSSDVTVSGYTIGTPGDWVYTSGTGSITNGNLTSTTGRYRGGGTNNQHPNVDDAASFFADVEFTASGGARAVTGRSVGYAGATSAAVKKAVGTGRMIAVGGLTVVTKKLAVVGGTGLALPGSTAAAAKITGAAGNAVGLGLTSAVAAKKLPAAGVVVGLALSTAIVTGPNVRAVTGRCVGFAIARHRRRVDRPSTGTVTRPNTGTVTRPYTGVVPRP